MWLWIGVDGCDFLLYVDKLWIGVICHRMWISVDCGGFLVEDHGGSVWWAVGRGGIVVWG